MAKIDTEYIRLSVKERGVMWKKVAEEMGLSQSQLSQKLNGKCGWSVDDLVGISRFLGVSMERLVK